MIFLLLLLYILSYLFIWRCRNCYIWWHVNT